MEQVRRIMMAILCVAFFQAGLSMTAAAQKPEDEGVVVQEVQVRILNDTPVVLLIVGDRFLPIHVDGTVAASIHSAVHGSATPRPLSHDLMRLMLLEFNAKVAQALITLKGQTYYGDLTVSLGDRTWVFDSRSSDAIALAVLFKARIIVDRATWESGGQRWSEPKKETS